MSKVRVSPAYNKVFTVCNASQKHESNLLHAYVLNEFLTAADRSCTTNPFEKSLIEAGSSHLYALEPFASKLVNF